MNEREYEREIHDLKERVAELESIVNRELGYNLRQFHYEPSVVDCDCGTTFEVNLVNGSKCPDCGEIHS